jgi:hypothetical protein
MPESQRRAEFSSENEDVRGESHPHDYEESERQTAKRIVTPRPRCERERDQTPLQYIEVRGLFVSEQSVVPVS